jgi:hypothetical protein
VIELSPDLLRTLAHAADYMAETSTAADRGGRCSAYLHRAADAARVAANAASCAFCKGQPVGDARTWLDDAVHPPCRCPRCGEVNGDRFQLAAAYEVQRAEVLRLAESYGAGGTLHTAALHELSDIATKLHATEYAAGVPVGSTREGSA